MLIHELTPDECRDVLRRSHLARLACSRHDQPYIVPIYAEFDGTCLYSFSTVGQKIDWMRANPKVCIEVDDVTDTAHWVSVVASGRVTEELTDAPDDRAGRHRARQLLERRQEFWLPAAAKLPSSEHPVTVLYRIRLDRITGRRAARQAPDPSIGHTIV